MTIKIYKKSPSYDHDDVRFIKDGKEIGFGYKGKLDGRLGLIRCPNCDSENYALSVPLGICSFCGFDANKVEVQ